MDDESLTTLLEGGHFNIPERFERNIWPHPPLKYDEVRNHLIKIIESREWFPCDLSYGREGVVIQKTAATFICHVLWYSAFGYPIISSKDKHEFTYAKDAADFYLKNDLHLPGDLDSWSVID